MAGDHYPVGTPFISKQYLGSINPNMFEGEENFEEEAGNYDIKESITAGYIRFDQKLGKKFSATVGLRVERTDLKTNGYILDTENGDGLAPTGEFKNHYTDLLPSLLLKYRFNEDGNIRASITKTISRPKYSALIANKTINTEDLEATMATRTPSPPRPST